MRIWIDTDVGTNPDDAIALLVALAHPEVELVGVSTVSGDVEARATDARRVLRSDAGSVPVIAGDAGLVDAVGAAAPDAICGIGPATNLSALADAEALPASVTLMGGALAPVTHRGALRRVETNIGADPEAAARLLASRPDALLVPLDVTVRTCLAEPERARLAAEVGARVVPPLDTWRSALCLHDPLALLALLDEPVVTVEPRRLRVRPDGSVRVGDGPARPVVVDVDPRAAVARVVDLLQG